MPAGNATSLNLLQALKSLCQGNLGLLSPSSTQQLLSLLVRSAEHAQHSDDLLLLLVDFFRVLTHLRPFDMPGGHGATHPLQPCLAGAAQLSAMAMKAENVQTQSAGIDFWESACLSPELVNSFVIPYLPGFVWAYLCFGFFFGLFLFFF